MAHRRSYEDWEDWDAWEEETWEPSYTTWPVSRGWSVRMLHPGERRPPPGLGRQGKGPKAKGKEKGESERKGLERRQEALKGDSDSREWKGWRGKAGGYDYEEDRKGKGAKGGKGKGGKGEKWGKSGEKGKAREDSNENGGPSVCRF
eukprot:g12958.t1